MRRTLRRWATWSGALWLLAGCATPTRPDAGTVVVAPQPQRPAPPALVLTTAPRPVGYFQRSLLDYFNGSPERPTR